MPDLFVPLDTSQSSPLFSALVRRGVLNTTAISFVDAHRQRLLGSYPEVSSFQQDFQVEGELYDLLWSEASKEGVERSETDLERSRELIELRLKALIARDLWNTSAYWQVINPTNPVDHSFQRAIEALSDDTFERLGLAERR